MRITVKKGESRTKTLDNVFKQKIEELKKSQVVYDGEWYVVRFYAKSSDEERGLWNETNLCWQYGAEHPFIDVDPDDLFEDWLVWEFDIVGMINVDDIYEMPIKL